MKGLTTALLARACRIFLELAYPGGEHTIPHPKSDYLTVPEDRPLGDLLVPPLCQVLTARDGSLRGYSLRLGSACHPHLKLQIVAHEEKQCVFSVDTHDTLMLENNSPDAPRWRQLQEDNHRLKEQIERAWQNAGLLTFKTLLRQELERRR